MQNKGLIRLFAILFGLVSIYQLSFTFITSKIEGDAERFAQVEVEEGSENYISQRERPKTPKPQHHLYFLFD